jgi:hypothetical protein
LELKVPRNLNYHVANVLTTSPNTVFRNACDYNTPNPPI